MKLVRKNYPLILVIGAVVFFAGFIYFKSFTNNFKTAAIAQKPLPTASITPNPAGRELSLNDYKAAVQKLSRLTLPEPRARKSISVSRLPGSSKPFILPQAGVIKAEEYNYADGTNGFMVSYGLAESVDAAAHAFTKIPVNFFNFHWTDKFGLFEYQDPKFEAVVSLSYISDTQTQIEVIIKNL